MKKGKLKKKKSDSGDACGMVKYGIATEGTNLVRERARERERKNEE